MTETGSMQTRNSRPPGRFLGTLLAMLAVFAVSGPAVTWQLARCPDCAEEADSNGQVQTFSLERRSTRQVFRGRRSVLAVEKKYEHPAGCQSRYSVANSFWNSVNSPQYKLPLRC